jgi:hypothetical protein
MGCGGVLNQCGQTQSELLRPDVSRLATLEEIRVHSLELIEIDVALSYTFHRKDMALRIDGFCPATA